MNSIAVTGRLTVDPTRRVVTTEAGERTVATLALAVAPERGREGEPCYIEVEVWGAPADACARWLAKGRLVAVTGRLSLDRWSGPDGTPRRAHRIVAATVEFLDRPAPDVAP